jgi:hypothetical protein
MATWQLAHGSSEHFGRLKDFGWVLSVFMAMASVRPNLYATSFQLAAKIRSPH